MTQSSLLYSAFFRFVAEIIAKLVHERYRTRAVHSCHEKNTLVPTRSAISCTEMNSRYFRFAFILQKGILFMMKFFTPIVTVCIDLSPRSRDAVVFICVTFSDNTFHVEALRCRTFTWSCHLLAHLCRLLHPRRGFEQGWLFLYRSTG